MMTFHRLRFLNPRKVSDPTMMLTLNSGSMLSLRSGCAFRLGSVARIGAVCLSFVAAVLTTAVAQQAPTSQPLVIADFNHDGIPDALVTSTTSPTATIAFGSVPYGTFNAASKAVAFPAACRSFNSAPLTVRGLQRGRPSRPGFLLQRHLRRCLLGNGDGTFAASKAITGAISANALIGDFNKDGKLDIVLLGLTFGPNTTAIGTLQFFAGNGDGTFAAAVNTQLDQTNYSAPLAADLNGDGYPDIVLLNLPADSPGSVNVFGNNQDGTFGAVAQGVSTAEHNGYRCGHCVHDSRRQLLRDRRRRPGRFEHWRQRGDCCLQKHQHGAVYSLNDPVTIPFAGLAASKAGAFTGLGFTDLAVANGTSITVLANDGAGNFSASYPALTLASNSASFALADANGDGYSDIYTATSTNGALSLAANVTTGSATATSQPFSLGIGTKTVSATWNGNVNFLASSATGQQIVTGAIAATTVTSSKNPSIVGDTVTFTASVVPAIAGRIPTGNVVFSDGATALATVALGEAGSATYATGTLTQATHSITVAYVGDNYFAASTSAVLLQLVNHAPAVASNLTWATPAAIVYGTALTSTQLDAVALDATGVAIPGTFAYTPAAGTVLDAGARVLSVTFTPTDLQSFVPATQTVTLTVAKAAPVLTWATPATIAAGTPLSATQLNASVVGLTGAALPGTFAYTPPAGTILASGTQTLSVVFTPTNALDYANAVGTVSLVVAPSLAATITAPPTTAPGSQTTITVTLAQPYPVDLVGTLTIGFARSTTPQLTDPSLQFAEGGTTLNFPIPANTTTIPPIQLQVGTIAGTITVPLTLTAAGVNVTPTDLPPVMIIVPPAVPSVSGMTVTRSGNQLTVVIHGFSNTREVVNAKFHFTAADGATIGTPDLTLPADTIFNTDWFDTDPSDAYGSTFTYTQIFNTSDGAANIGTVDATLTNTVGPSTTMTAK